MATGLVPSSCVFTWLFKFVLKFSIDYIESVLVSYYNPSV